ncbi:hypothetical protein FHG64_18875 [Antarcticibacterium flavum]|uniref:Uncharacterized protein n=1 Tax=Antarcticibacterium flavum TaxID=2058175 RepID=A0A5B7X9L1_9FLAO|nr:MULTISPECIES: DUF6146 family protein [Antarcticibacterium]MCM4160330.1 hypothetical protein [Antarcticibacterium sp. W02-3]QCY71291.1 hypothetical protein FHG64_18875 [Antarcticibacterium flavum]
MKKFLYLLFLGVMIYSCGTSRDRDFNKKEIAATANDTVRIANDSLEYEIIIIEPGFNLFINSIARPRGYYSQTYFENKNRFLVQDYNMRVRNPQQFNPNLYVQEINYEPDIDYGYEVNYLLYNYFVFFSREYNQRFSVPTRI